MKTILCVLALLCPMAASAQTVFFDDFDGNTLLPHWNQPPPSHWEYNVSNSRLNVTKLLSPGIRHLSFNIADMVALFPQQTDFRVDVWMGWDQFTSPHRLALNVLGPGGSAIVASVGYRWDGAFGPNPVIFAGGGGQAVGIPPPPPGTYQFTITREAAEFNFYFDGNLFATFRDAFGTPAGGLHIQFLGSWDPSAPFGALHIDRVQVVPTPGMLLIALPLGLACVCGRTRRSATTNQGAMQ